MIMQNNYTKEEIEKTREDILKILEDDFYPYLMEWDITDRTMQLVMAVKDRYSLKEIVDKLHEVNKNIYHQRKGTNPKDYSKHQYMFAND